MNYDEQTDALYIELTNLINRFVKEFDLNTSTVIGVLEEKKIDLIETGTFFFNMDDLDIPESLESDEDDLLDE